MTERGARAGAAAVAVLTTLLVALAFGAVWALLAAWGLNDDAWLAFAAAAGMVFSLRFAGSQHGWFPALLAGGGTLLAALYAECLQLLMRIAAQLGLPLIEVIHTSGILSTGQLAWRLLPESHLLTYLAAAVLAALLTGSPRPRHGT